MTKIIPIRDLKDTAKISMLCHENDEPVFITKNGYEDMVIMSVALYDQLNSGQRFYPKSIMPELNVAEPLAPAYNASNAVYSIDEIKEILKPIFKKFKVKNAVLFGSYAKGKATDKSDIDILVDSGLKGLKFFGLLDDVAEALRFPVDLIDLQDLNKESELAYEIAKTGVQIYG